MYGLRSFIVRVPSLTEHMAEGLKQALFDKDPSVMAAAVSVYYHLIKVCV